MIYSIPKLKSKWTNKLVEGVCKKKYKSEKGEICTKSYYTNYCRFYCPVRYVS